MGRERAYNVFTNKDIIHWSITACKIACMPRVKSFKSNTTDNKNAVTCPFCLKIIADLKLKKPAKKVSAKIEASLSDMQINFNYKPLYKSDKQIYTDTEIKRINDNIIKKFRLKLITTETAIRKIEENSTHVQIEAEKEFKSCMKRIENLTDFVGDRHKK